MSSRAALSWHKTLKRALSALLFMAPLVFFSKTYEAESAKTLAVQIIAVVALAALSAKTLERGRFELEARALKVLLPGAALFIWTTARFLGAPGRLVRLPGLLEQIVPIVLFCACLLELGGLENAQRLTDWILSAAWLSCLLGAKTGSAEPRLIFLAACWPLIFAKLLDPERDRYLKLFDLGLAGILGGTMIFAGSAPGLATFALVAVLSAAATAAFMPFRPALKAAGLSLIAAAAIVAAALSVNPAALETSALNAARFRQAAWPAAERMAVERPVVGQGAGGFFINLPRFQTQDMVRFAGPAAEVRYPGCELLRQAAENGLVGALLWSWLFLSVLVCAWRAREILSKKAAFPHLGYLSGFSAATLGLLAAAQFNAGFYAPLPQLILWLFCAMAAGLALSGLRGGLAVVAPVSLSQVQLRRLYAPAALILTALLYFPFQWFASGIHQNLAVRFARQKQWTLAVSEAQEVRAGAPEYPMALYLKAEGLLAAGRPREALGEYARLEALAPDYGQIHYQKALAYAALGDWRQAVASHERAAALDASFVPNYAAWAAAARSAGDYKSAEKALFNAIALEPKQPAYWRSLGDIYRLAHSERASRRVYRQARRLKASSFPNF